MIRFQLTGQLPLWTLKELKRTGLLIARNDPKFELWKTQLDLFCDQRNVGDVEAD